MATAQELTDKAMSRLKKIEGQAGGIYKMLEEGRYCVDVMTQIAAVESALREVKMIILKRHMNTCVLDAVGSKSKKASNEKMDELVAIFSKFGR